MSNSSRWGFVLRWQLAGMVVTLAAPAALIVMQAVMAGLSLLSAMRVMSGQMVWIFVIVLLITPLSLLTLWGFAVWRARVPAADATPFAMVVSAVGVSCVLALLTGLVSHWELVIRFPDARAYVREVWSVTRAVLPWSLLGVVGGRVVMMGIRAARSPFKIV